MDKTGADSDGESLHLAQALKAVWAFRWLVVGVTALFLAMAVFAYARVKPKYVSNSKFICKDNSGSNLAGLSALASLAGIQPQSKAGGANPSEYFNEILTDDEFLERVLDRKWEYRNASKTLPEIWGLLPDTTLPEWEYAYRKTAAATLRGNKYIELTKNMDNGVFTLKTRFSDAKLAKQVNEIIIQLLNQYLTDNLASTTREKRLFIEKRLMEIEGELKRNENAMVSFREGNRDVMAPKLLLEQNRLQRSLRVNEELYLQLKKEYEMAKIEESNNTPLIEVISKPTAPLGPDAGKKKFILPAGVILGLVSGIFLALGLGWYRGMLA